MSMDEENEDWRRDVPDPERLGDESRISDAEWHDLVDRLAEPSPLMGDMPAEEIRDRLEENEHWEPGPVAPVGWRTAAPSLMLSLIAAVGAVVLLLFGILFLRPMSDWFLLGVIVVGIGGAIGLFFHLPSSHSDGGGDGAEV